MALRAALLTALSLLAAPAWAQERAPQPAPATPPAPVQPREAPPPPAPPSAPSTNGPAQAQPPAPPSPAQDTPPPASAPPTPAPPATPRAREAEAPSQVPLDEIRRYVTVYNAVKQAYVEPVDDARLMRSAIRGLLLDLDPHSTYFEKNQASEFDDQSRGAYDGIGVELLRNPDGTLKIIAPIDDTPAARAGLKAGDLVIAIDGRPLAAGDDDQSGPLRGPPGSRVVLSVVRAGRDAPFDITVVRDTIRVASVRSRMLEPGYGYLRVAAFQADTAADFEKQLEALKTQAGGRLRGVVIDLRSNPGGLLTSAVQIADALLERGAIVSTRGRLAISDAQFGATPGDRLAGAPVVVLVDAGSASASEVLAGALRDNGRARVVGSRTFGKGSVQTVLPLDNGDSVKLTTARYYTPSGRSIQALGIVPDVVFRPEGDTQAAASALRNVTEAALRGHLAGDEPAPGTLAGDVLEGEAYVTRALAELKAPTTPLAPVAPVAAR